MRMRKPTAAVTALLTAAACCGFTANAGLNDWEHLPDRGDESSVADLGYSQFAPRLTVENVVLDNGDEARGKTVTVRIMLSGNNLDNRYCSTGFHVYWDDRLTPVPARNGKFARAGEAVEELNFFTENIKEYGAFVMTSGSGDMGMSGEFVSFEFTLPENAADGDVYPIDIAYRSDERKSDLFTNIADDDEGRRMQAHLFRLGIYSSQNPNYSYIGGKWLNYADGYIHVDSKPVTTTTTTTTATTTTTTTEPIPVYTLGDANRDGMIDARDAAAVLTNYAYMSVGIVPEKAVLLASDVDGDGMADGRDATLILTYYSKASAGKAGGFEDFISRR